MRSAAQKIYSIKKNQESSEESTQNEQISAPVNSAPNQLYAPYAPPTFNSAQNFNTSTASINKTPDDSSRLNFPPNHQPHQLPNTMIPPPLNFRTPQINPSFPCSQLPQQNPRLENSSFMNKLQPKSSFINDLESLYPGSNFNDILSGNKVKLVKDNSIKVEEEKVISNPYQNLNNHPQNLTSKSAQSPNFQSQIPQRRFLPVPQFIQNQRLDFPPYVPQMQFGSSLKQTSPHPPKLLHNQNLNQIDSAIPHPLESLSEIPLNSCQIIPPKNFSSILLPTFNASSNANLLPHAAFPIVRDNQEIVYQVQDVNVFEICMDELKKDNTTATGDPVFCSGCNAVFNFFSKASKIDNSEQILWKCEFCSCETMVHLDEEEIPKESKLVYVLEPTEQCEISLEGCDDSSTIIFCIDVSGSMCVSQPIAEKALLKSSKLKDLQNLLGKKIKGPQYMPGEDQNLTYVSRLECVQAAIDFQLTNMQLKTPNKYVGVVTFNDEVTILGDGSQTVNITGDRLYNFERIWETVDNKHSEFVGRFISETKDQLSQKILSLEETGSTALGPALLVSVALACQGKPGSKVIICTDGIANVGLGSVENLQDLPQANEFYRKVAAIAKEKGVLINVISIASEECRIATLSEMVDETGGELIKVNPSKLSNDFANILAQEVIATNVILTVNLHKSISFKNQDPSLIQPEGNRLIKKFGNVTEDTMYTFECILNSTDDIDKIPFQVEIEYRKTNGMRCVLIDTQVLQVSNDKEEIIKNTNFEVLARNAQVQSTSLARQGNYSEAVESLNI